MNKTKFIVGALALLALASPAAGQDSKYYIGGSYGMSLYRGSCELLATPCDDKDTALRGFAGYRFNRSVGMEIGFAGLGHVESAGLKARQVIAGDASALITFPLAAGFSAHGRLGIYRARSKVFGDAKQNSGWTYGAGLGYDLGFIGVRGEWQRFANVGTGGIGEDTIDVWSVGGLIRF
jgi:hypothetical protein